MAYIVAMVGKFNDEVQGYWNGYGWIDANESNAKGYAKRFGSHHSIGVEFHSKNMDDGLDTKNYKLKTLEVER